MAIQPLAQRLLWLTRLASNDLLVFHLGPDSFPLSTVESRHSRICYYQVEASSAKSRRDATPVPILSLSDSAAHFAS